MPRNQVQFQPGLSLTDFLKRYGTEEQCREAVFKLRWPTGFNCPACGHKGACCQLARQLYQCNRCHHQASLTARTIFDSTKLPLTTWFLAIYLLTQRKNSLSALQLSRELGVSYNTAWKLKHKIMQVMFEREQCAMLSGRIEIDDAYLGGERSGKRGRGSENKVPFIAVVQTSAEGHPQYLQLRRVRAFTAKEIDRYAQRSVVPGSTVHSDGLACFKAFDTRGCQHLPTVTGGGRASARLPVFKWVNTLLGNVKNALTGTFHSFDLKHAPRYLAEFEYRFNRRFNLGTMIERFSYVALRTPPMPYRLLRLAEVYT
ncbi:MULTISPECIES: IS1595 family transposase [Pseudomonadota]|uniref:IS1595 family transposase n=1 Tax=Pseudomonadota TaxID=1224 RepID=UPI001BD0FDF4|nr:MULTISPECIES: IS1595 family transposase [Pseudomonadota]MCK2094616.1 IS1595 family transposase [Thauera aromatica]